MALTVEQLAGHLGRSVEDVLDACRQSGVLVWGASTPLDDREASAVAARLGAGALPQAPTAPPAPPASGPAPAPFGPPPGSTWSAPPGPPPPPPPGAWSAPAQPWGVTPPPPPPGFRPSGARRTGRFLSGFLVFLAIAGARIGARIWFEDRDDSRSTSSELIDAGAGAVPPSDELRVGDCYVDPSGQVLTETEAQELSLRAVPCEGSHDGEVFFLTRLSHGAADPYPGDDPLFNQAAPDCVAAFGTYVGTPYEQSTLDFVVHFPSAQGWRFGDREIYCSAITIDGTQLAGTVQGSGR